MSFARRHLPALFVVALLTVSCGEPPDKEMQQAQGAIDAARAAGAEEYARAEFGAAQEALKHAQEAVAQRDYRLALNHALDSRERAQNAAKETADQKAKARTDADRAITSASAALADARAKLKAAENARAQAAKVAAARSAIDRGDHAVQEARAAFGRAEYLAVVQAATAATTNLRATARDLEAAAPPAGHRRR